jgi:hypothetical protein
MTMTGKMEPFGTRNQTGHRILLAMQHQAQAGGSKRDLLES